MIVCCVCDQFPVIHQDIHTWTNSEATYVTGIWIYMAHRKGKYPNCFILKGYFPESTAQSKLIFNGWHFEYSLKSQLFYNTLLTVEVPFGPLNKHLPDCSNRLTENFVRKLFCG